MTVNNQKARQLGCDEVYASEQGRLTTLRAMLTLQRGGGVNKL